MYQKVILQHETRKVDKYGYISFCIRKYETKPALIGYKVEIPYNPAALETITASYPRYGSFHRRIQSESENSVTKTRLFPDALESIQNSSIRWQIRSHSLPTKRRLRAYMRHSSEWEHTPLIGNMNRILSVKLSDSLLCG